MRDFVSRVAVFSIPIGVVYGLPLLFLVWAGEIPFNLKSTIIEQVEGGTPFLLRYRYNERPYKFYKFQSAVEHQAPVLALGSSRVLQFRSNSFQRKFYNAGYSINGISDFRVFLELLLKHYKPETVLIGLDPWMFNQNWDDFESQSRSTKPENYLKLETSNSGELLTAARSVWSDLFKSKYQLKNIISSGNDSLKLVGLGARSEKAGFRRDGSIYYGDEFGLETLWPKPHESFRAKDKFSDTLQRIEGGIRQFQPGASVNLKAIRELRELFSFLKENEIQAIAFVSPVSNTAYRAMKKSSKYEYLELLEPMIREVTSEFSSPFFYFPDLLSLESTDEEAIDGFHGSERVYLKMLLEMAKESEPLLKVLKPLKQLQSDLENSSAPHAIYP